MSNLLIINAEGPEVRVALLENGQVAELYVERARERSIVGNIYKGRVTRVLPGMQAAFIDIGTDKAAFLYVAEVRGEADDVRAFFGEEDESGAREKNHADKEGGRSGPRIEDLLKAGQDQLIQITKSPMGTKGARSTSYISLPGRNLVFLPTMNHVGISRRISSEKERKRLRSIIDAMRPPGTGLIVRTVAETASDADLHADMEFLIRLWNSILKNAESSKAPALLYQDLDLSLRTIREMLTGDIERVVVDSQAEFDRLSKFVGAFMPQFLSRIELYQKPEPIFDYYNIEVEVDRALDRKVFLKSGGTLVIDQREALTTIDVNTGRFVGKKNLEETITKTNLEACKEVADQLRIRNLGGILIIDFIDMDIAENREKVIHAFSEALHKDRARTSVGRLSELGLMEMTRKRTHESLNQMLTEPCFYCEGKGYLKSKISVGYEVLRQIRRCALMHPDMAVTAQVHPEIAELLLSVEQAYLEDLEKRLGKKIVIQAKKGFHLEKYHIVAGSTLEA